MHYQRKRASGTVGPSAALKKPKGSRSIHKSTGYMRIGQRLEHSLVMEQIPGRPLRPFEEVHHKNGIKHDNAPSNLELWAKPQPAGQRPEDLVAWVLDNYEDLVRAELTARERARVDFPDSIGAL